VAARISRIYLQVRSILDVADNTGAKRAAAMRGEPNKRYHYWRSDRRTSRKRRREHGKRDVVDAVWWDAAADPPLGRLVPAFEQQRNLNHLTRSTIAGTRIGPLRECAT